MATILERLQETYSDAPGINDARNIAEAISCVTNGSSGRGANAIADVMQEYSVFTFDPNGGEGTRFRTYFPKGADEVIIPECPFTPPTGKMFGYWILPSAGDSIEGDEHINPGPADYGTIGNQTFYAGWVDAE